MANANLPQAPNLSGGNSKRESIRFKIRRRTGRSRNNTQPVRIGLNATTSEDLNANPNIITRRPVEEEDENPSTDLQTRVGIPRKLEENAEGARQPDPSNSTTAVSQTGEPESPTQEPKNEDTTPESQVEDANQSDDEDSEQPDDSTESPDEELAPEDEDSNQQPTEPEENYTPENNTYDSEQQNDNKKKGLFGNLFNRNKDGTANRDKLKEDEEAGAADEDSTISGKKKSKTIIGSKSSADDKGDDQTDRLAQLKALLGTRRRKAIAGGTAGGIIGLIFTFAIFQGPLQLIHLAQILQKPSFGNQQTVNIRFTALFRYARSGDIGEARMTTLSVKTYRNTLSQLKAQGIEFQTNRFGVPESATFDMSKDPELKSLKGEEQLKAFKAKYRIPDTQTVEPHSSGYKVPLEADNVKGMKFTKVLLKTSIGKLGNGTIQTFMQYRFMKTALALPKLFSPLGNQARAKVSAKASKLDANKRNAEREAELTKAQEEKIAGDKSALKKFLKDNQGKVALALIGTTLVCEVRGIADNAVSFNHNGIVLESDIKTLDKQAVGSQVQSGQGGLESSEVGAVSDSLIDANGRSIWGAKSLQVLSGKTNPSGPDLPPEYGQAFSNKTTADNILKSVEVKKAGIDLTGAACSTGGQIVTGIAGAALLVSGFFDFGASWGAYAATQTAIAAGTVGVIYMLEKQAGPLLHDNATIPAQLAGDLGGNLMAYSAMDIAGMVGRSAGGIPLSASETVALNNEQHLADQSDWNSKSLAEKLFDVHDYHSVASKAIDNTSPSVTQNMAKLGSMFTNFGSLFSSASKVLTPLASADTKPYDWGFPLYGIPRSVSEDPKFADPYDNAEKVAALLDADTGNNLAERAKNCFGVDISKDSSDKWQAVAKEDVNPGASSYTGANCAQDSENWHRVMLFVFDSRQMDIIDCYATNDPTSCGNVGFGATASETVSASTSTGVSNNKVYLVGDSLSVGMNGANLSKKMTDAGWQLLAVNAHSGDPLQTGINQVDQNKATVAEAGVVIVELGTNNEASGGPITPAASFAPGVKAMIDKIKAINPSAKIYWVNAYNDGNHSAYSGINSTISNQASSLGYSVIDWHSEAQNNNSKYAPFDAAQHLHPFQHYGDMADFIIGALGSPASSGTAGSSSGGQCAVGSQDVGESTGYENGSPKTVRLCAIEGLKIDDFTSGKEGAESTPGSSYYIEGANNRALVDASVSQDVVNMVKAAKADGVTLVAFSSFRTNEHQKILYAGGGLYAEPGKSAHQRGFAIDFVDSNRNSTKLCRETPGHIDSTGRCVAPDSNIWKWLSKNASKFNYQQFKDESWHWSPDGS